MIEPFDHLPPITLPAWWTKRYPSPKLHAIVRNTALWMDRPASNTAAGKQILLANAALFELAMLLEDVDYTLEDIESPFFELVPGFLHRQGIGFSAGKEDCVRLDLYFFPLDYSEKKEFPLQYIRLPVMETDDYEALVRLAQQRFPAPEGLTASLPFSLGAIAEVEGHFLDHMPETARSCRAAAKNALERQNCEAFLGYVNDILNYSKQKGNSRQ